LKEVGLGLETLVEEAESGLWKEQQCEKGEFRDEEVRDKGNKGC